MTTQQVKWSFEADYYQPCNCNYGCPCEYEAPPTRGFCDGALIWRINQGSYGNVSLDGLSLGVAAHWPGPLYLGNGTGAIFIDERANQEQREALIQIVSGRAGGMPFEIAATTFSKVLGPFYVPFHYDISGKSGTVRVGDAISATFGPIKNPMTGEPEGIRLEHETGFIFKGADVVSAREFSVSADELRFACTDTNGFITQVKYGN